MVTRPPIRPKSLGLDLISAFFAEKNGISCPQALRTLGGRRMRALIERQDHQRPALWLPGPGAGREIL